MLKFWLFLENSAISYIYIPLNNIKIFFLFETGAKLAILKPKFITLDHVGVFSKKKILTANPRIWISGFVAWAFIVMSKLMGYERSNKPLAVEHFTW